MARLQALVASSRRRMKAVPILRPTLRTEPTAPGRLFAPAPHAHRALRLSWHGALSQAQTELLRVAVRRSRTALACPCGGHAVRVRCTGSERARFGGESFARAFVCIACHTRFVGRALAPHPAP
jgi:hypothetical protein